MIWWLVIKLNPSKAQCFIHESTTSCMLVNVCLTTAETPGQSGWAETPRTERSGGGDLIQETPTPGASKRRSRWDETPTSQMTPGNATPTPHPSTPLMTPSGVTPTGQKAMIMATPTPGRQ